MKLWIHHTEVKH